MFEKYVLKIYQKYMENIFPKSWIYSLIYLKYNQQNSIQRLFRMKFLFFSIIRFPQSNLIIATNLQLFHSKS